MSPEQSRNMLERLGANLLAGLRYAGGITLLLGTASRWATRSVVARRRRGESHLAAQLVRLAVQSLPIVALVQLFIGVILVLQLSPPLAEFGQQASVSRIIGVGGFRMLAPVITAVVLCGFAGASIAAELGTMVVSEEIEALQAQALNPVRFLVVPRILATLIAMLLLTVVADVMIALGGFITARLVLGPDSYAQYWDQMREQLKYRDFFTGLTQGSVFGLLISLIACYEGLKTTGGAEGVGRATTMTVVYSIVAIVLSSCVFTVVFYIFKL